MSIEHEQLSYGELIDALSRFVQEQRTGTMFIVTESRHSARISLAATALSLMSSGKHVLVGGSSRRIHLVLGRGQRVRVRDRNVTAGFNRRAGAVVLGAPAPDVEPGRKVWADFGSKIAHRARCQVFGFSAAGAATPSRRSAAGTRNAACPPSCAQRPLPVRRGRWPGCADWPAPRPRCDRPPGRHPRPA